MRVGIIAIQHESNTFAIGTTRLEHFQVDTLLRGDEITPKYGKSFHEVGGFYTGLAEAQIAPVPILMALAIPGGTVSAETLETILAMLDEELDKALASGPLDGLLVAPHGAGVCESQPDMDGYWVSRIRERFGPFDLVMLEVGAFHPSWGDIHLGPANALKAHALLGGGTLLPVHWGTFSLAMHAWDEPAETLLSLAAERVRRSATSARACSAASRVLASSFSSAVFSEESLSCRPVSSALRLVSSMAFLLESTECTSSAPACRAYTEKPPV